LLLGFSVSLSVLLTACGGGDAFPSLIVASRMIVRAFYKQMRMRSVPVFHGPHRGFALERRLG